MKLLSWTHIVLVILAIYINNMCIDDSYTVSILPVYSPNVSLLVKRSFNRDISTSELQARQTSSMWPCSQGSSKSTWTNKYKCLWEQQPKYRESKVWRNVFLSWTLAEGGLLIPVWWKQFVFLHGLLNARYLWGGEGVCMSEACTQTYRAFSPFGGIKISLTNLMQSCCPVWDKHTIHLQSSLLAICARELALSHVITRH